MAKPSISNRMTEIEFLTKVGPLLESVAEEILGGIEGIGRQFPEVNEKNYSAMMQRGVTVPYPWFIWMSLAAQFAIERYELLKTTPEGNG